MNPTHLEYERKDLYNVLVIARYANSEHKEPMGLLPAGDVPENELPELTKEYLVI